MTAMIENGDGQGKELQNQLVASVEQLIDDSGWAEQLDSFLRDKLKEEQDLQQNSQQDSLPVYLTPKQAAKQFGYPPVTLSKWAAQGLIEYKKNERGNKLYLQSSLEEKVAKTSRQPSQEPEQTREPSHQLDSDEQLIDGSVVTEPERFREDMEDKLKQEELEQTVGSAVILNQLYSNSNNEIANIIMAQLNQNLAEYKDEVVDGIKVYIDEKLQDLYTENQELKNELKAYIEASRQPLNKHKPGFFSTISRKVSGFFENIRDKVSDAVVNSLDGIADQLVSTATNIAYDKNIKYLYSLRGEGRDEYLSFEPAIKITKDEKNQLVVKNTNDEIIPVAVAAPFLARLAELAKAEAKQADVQVSENSKSKGRRR